MSYEKLGFTSGQTLKAEHLNHMEDGIANCGSPSWNDLTDKPFGTEQAFEPIVYPDALDNLYGRGESTVFRPDATEYVDAFNLKDLLSLIVDFYAYKISDNIPPENAYLSAKVDYSALFGNTCEIGIADIIVPGAEVYAVELRKGTDDENTSTASILLAVVRNDDSGVPVGVYMSDMLIGNAVCQAVEWAFTISKEIVTPLDEKYLPESVDGVVIRSSTEHSTKKFKLTVDDTGAITATEV